MSRVFSRNFISQKEVQQSIIYKLKGKKKKQKPITKNALHGKMYHSELKEKEFSRQAEVKGVHHHYSGLTRNVKVLLEAEKAINKLEKTVKGKISLIKANIKAVY